MGIQEAKRHLSRFMKRVEAGESIILCDRDRPIAEIRPIKQPKSQVRFGLFKGEIQIAEDFDESLPEFERDFYSDSLQ